MIRIISVWVRDNETKTNHQHEFWGFSLEQAMDEAKWELDDLYPSGYTISLQGRA